MSWVFPQYLGKKNCFFFSYVFDINVELSLCCLNSLYVKMKIKSCNRKGIQNLSRCACPGIFIAIEIFSLTNVAILSRIDSHQNVGRSEKVRGLPDPFSASSIKITMFKLFSYPPPEVLQTFWIGINSKFTDSIQKWTNYNLCEIIITRFSIIILKSTKRSSDMNDAVSDVNSVSSLNFLHIIIKSLGSDKHFSTHSLQPFRLSHPRPLPPLPALVPLILSLSFSLFSHCPFSSLGKLRYRAWVGFKLWVRGKKRDGRRGMMISRAAQHTRGIISLQASKGTVPSGRSSSLTLRPGKWIRRHFHPLQRQILFPLFSHPLSIVLGVFYPLIQRCSCESFTLFLYFHTGSLERSNAE